MSEALKYASKGGLLDRSEESRKFLSVGYGRPLSTGTRYQNRALARTLEAIAFKGPNAFYQGAFAKGLEREVRKHGGSLSASDLRNYQVHKSTLSPIQYGNLSIYTSPLPSSGEVFFGQLFGMLEQFGQSSGELPTDIHTLAELQSLAFEDRAKFLGDPKFSRVDTDRLLEKSYLRKKLEGLSIEKRETPDLHDVLPVPTSTTHLSIIDRQGNIVSSTQSINHYFGSGVFYKGVFLNNTLDDFSDSNAPNQFGLLGNSANAPEAGKTPLSLSLIHI